MNILASLIHAVILWSLRFSPFPELFVYPYLTARGFLPYAQILDQHFPGLMFFPIIFFFLVFPAPAAFKLLLILIVLLQSALVYKISRSRLAVLAYALWQPIFEGNYLWLDTFLGLFILPAFFFFTSGLWIWSGLFLGMGVVFKQTLIPLVAFAAIVLLWRRKFAALVKFSLAALFPSILILAYFYSRGILQDFWYWTVQFNLTTYAAGGRGGPNFSEIIKLAIPILVLILVWFKNREFRLGLGWLIFSVIGAVARFDLLHLQPAIPFLAIAFSKLFSRSRNLAAGLFVLSILLFGVFYIRAPKYPAVLFFDKDTDRLVSAIKNRVSDSDKIFLLGVQPHLYALTGTLPPGNIFVFQFPWFLKIAGRRVLDSLKTDPPSLVVYDDQNRIDGQYLRDYASYLVEYVQSHYLPVYRQGSVTIYARRN